MFLKLGTRNVHHKRNKMTPIVPLLWQLSRLQFLSAKKQIFHLQPLKARQRILLRTDMVPILSKLSSLDCRESMIQKLGISVSIETRPATKLLPWRQHNRYHFVSYDAKFEVHRSNTSSDIFYSIFCHFSCTTNDVVTFLI